MATDWSIVKNILNGLGLCHAGFGRGSKLGFWRIRVFRSYMSHDRFQSLIESKFILHGMAIKGNCWFALVEVKKDTEE